MAARRLLILPLPPDRRAHSKEKRMKHCKLMVLGTTLLACSLAFGQTAPTPPTPAQHVAHRVQFLTRALGLTSDQQNQATTIFTAAANAESGLRANLKAAHDSLETAIEANDTAGIATASEKLGQLHGQEIQAHSTAQAAFRAILTPDQQVKFKGLHGPHGSGHGMPFGPEHLGAPGPPPPPVGD